jgi:hypothetical protein
MRAYSFRSAPEHLFSALAESGSLLCRHFRKMFEGYEGKSGQQAVQEVYPITSEGRLVDTIKKRHIHERNVVRYVMHNT